MSDDTAVPDRLSRAIVDFREEVVLWIDTALARLRELESLEPGRSSVPAAPGRSFASLTRGELEPISRWGGNREAEPMNGLAPVDGPPRRGAATPVGDAALDSQSSPMDSLTRLDALARLLDERLKVSGEESSHGSGGNGATVSLTTRNTRDRGETAP